MAPAEPLPFAPEGAVAVLGAPRFAHPALDAVAMEGDRLAIGGQGPSNDSLGVYLYEGERFVRRVDLPLREDAKHIEALALHGPLVAAATADAVHIFGFEGGVPRRYEGGPARVLAHSERSVAAAGDGLWRIDSQGRRVIDEQHEYTHLAFAGEVLFAVRGDGSVWRSEGESFAQVQGSDAPVVALGTADGQPQVWRWDGEVLQGPEGERSLEAASVSVDPAGRWLFVQTEEGVVVEERGELRDRWPGAMLGGRAAFGEFAVAIDADGALLVSGESERQAHRGAVQEVAWVGERIVTNAADGLRVWASGGYALGHVAPEASELPAGELRGQPGASFAAYYRSHLSTELRVELAVFDVESRVPLNLEGRVEQPGDLRWRPGGNVLTVLSGDELHFHDVNKEGRVVRVVGVEALASQPGSDAPFVGPVLDHAWSPDGLTLVLVLGGETPGVAAFRALTGETLAWRPGEYRRVRVAPDGASVAVTEDHEGGAPELHFLRFEDLEGIGTLALETPLRDFDWRGDTIAWVGFDGVLYVKQGSASPRRIPTPIPATALSVSPDGSQVALGAVDGRSWVLAL